jgi:hypothetical protein
MPHDLPNGKTVSHSFRQWKLQGVWEQAMTALRPQVPRNLGREEEPSAANTLSRSIKTSAIRGNERGFDTGEKSGAANVIFWLIRKASSWPSRSTVQASLTEKESNSFWQTFKHPFLASVISSLIIATLIP